MLRKTPIKLVMVSGQPGSRVDFVAGWLGTLPDFVNNFWYINPETGQSNGRMRVTKKFRNNTDIDEVLSTYEYRLSLAAQLTLAGAWHPCKLEKLDSYIDSGLVSICHINVEPEYVAKVFWENRVKTLLSSWTATMGQKQQSLHWDIDQVIVRDGIAKIEDITDQTRSEFFESQLKRNRVLVPTALPHPHLIISYKELFQPGGSYYLCNKLGIAAGQQYHKFWDLMLQAADSPHEITVWGRTWRQQDWPVGSCVMTPELHS